MKVVLDTMMWVSFGTRRDGYRHSVLERAWKARVRLFVSAYILDELTAVLAEGLGLSGRFVQLARRAVLRRAQFVDLPLPPRAYVPGDPNDDAIVQTKADYVVTADQVLLTLGKVQDVELISLSSFEERLPLADK
jgi:predicted nucleic acid-binding protein